MAEKNICKYRDTPEVLDHLVGVVALCLVVCMMLGLSFFLLARLSLSTTWDNKNWMFFWEVVGTVLVCRMFLIEDLKRMVGKYAFILGLVTWGPVVLAQPEIGMLFIVLHFVIGWFTYKITWDVTDLGDREEDEDGLLASAGFKKELNPGKKSDSESWGDMREEGAEYNFEAEEVLKNLANEKPKKPKGGKGRGIWVLYFVFAAIPIFGFFGSTNSSSDPRLDNYFLICLGVYLFSGIGLLMTTAFLTIRKDLRRRHLSMPLFTSVSWLFSGLLVLVGCSLFSSVLPRPKGTVDPVAFFTPKNSDRDASSYAKSSKDAGKGEGRPGEQKGEKGSTVSGKNDSNKETKEDSRKGKQESGQNKNDEGSKAGKTESAKSKQESGQNKNDEDSKAGKTESAKSKQESGQNKKPNDSNDKLNKDQEQKSNNNNSAEPTTPPPSNSFNIPGLDKLMQFVEMFIKVVFGVGTFLLVLYVVVYKLSFQLDWAQDLLKWFRNLFEWFEKPKKKGESKVSSEEITPQNETASFENFQNPFNKEGWQKIEIRQLTGYTWKAFLAWCKARNIKLPDGCTPSELEQIIANEEPKVEAAYFAFQQIFLNSQYGKKNNDPKAVLFTRRLWDQMEESGYAANPTEAE